MSRRKSCELSSTLFLVGKLTDRREGSFSLPAGDSKGSSLIFLQDSLSKRKFLVDSGASVSVFPCSSSSKFRSDSDIKLLTADGSTMYCSGTRIIPLRFGSRSYDWSFHLAPVSTPILGADFLRHHHLLVDMAGRRVLESSTLNGVGESLSSSDDPGFLRAALLSTPECIRELLSEYPDVLSSDGFTASPPRHSVRHHLLTQPGPPVFAKARRLDPVKLETAKKEFAAMEEAGIIRRSTSPWSSPLHMVKKKDGTWRPCGDYRRLNNVTVPDRYPLPNIADFSAQISGSKIFSKLDLQKGYYQVPMAEDDIKKTAIITPFGMFEFLRLPFGLRNAGQTFQRLMDQVLGGLPFCFVYVDDILIFSPDLSSHVDHLREVLELCRLHGLTIGLPKCEFAVSEVEFLGHNLSSSGCKPLVKHTAVIGEFPVPSDKPALQRFLGMINFYRKFIKNAALILAPLTDALKGPGKRIVWTPGMDAAFHQAKRLLSAVPTLAHPAPGSDISVAVDASESHVGAVFQQQVGKDWVPLSFYSRKLNEAEKKYSAFDRELLAAYSAVRHFRFMLEGRDFTIFTDHKPLTFAISRTSPPWSARQQRHLSFISEFTSRIVYLPGAENCVADALSRPVTSEPSPHFKSTGTQTLPSPANSVRTISPAPSLAPVPGFSFDELVSHQSSCSSVQSLLSSPSLKIISVPCGVGEIKCDVSTGVPRPIVPLLLRRKLFNLLHSVSHPGIRGSRRLISSRFVWPKMSTEIGSWARSCLQCQRSKISSHVRSIVPQIPVPGRRFSHVHIDIVGPLPSSHGFSYLLTMIDRTTRWPEAVPLSSITAESCIQAFISTWVSRFGVPSTLTSDRGSQFVSSVWTGVCRELGISPSRTTAYHPQANGMIERFHRSLKVSLRARAAGSNWVQHLPLVMLGLRVVPKEDTGFCSAEAVYGSSLCVPGEFLSVPELPPDSFLRKIQLAKAGFSSPPPHHGVCPSPSPLPSSLIQADFVFVREDASVPSLSPLYRGPYKVLERRDKFFRLQIGDKVDTVSVDRLKPVISDSTIVPARPPTRGRPILRPRLDKPGPSAAAPPLVSKKVRFQPQSLAPARRNPHRSARDRSR